MTKLLTRLVNFSSYGMDNEDTLPSLVKALDDSDRTVRANVVNILSKLSGYENIPEVIGAANVIKPVLQLFNDPNPIVRQEAIDTIYNLVIALINQDRIREADGIVPLIRLLSHENEDILSSVVSGLSILAENQVKILFVKLMLYSNNCPNY